MLRIIKLLIFILLISTAFLSCFTKTKKPDLRNKQEISEVNRRVYFDNNIFDKPTTGNYQKQLGALLGLPDISKGYDSLSIRIWLWGADTTFVINLSFSNLESKSEIISYGSEVFKDSAWLIIFSDTKNTQPLSGWDSLHLMIDKYKIKSQTSHSTENFKIGGTGGANFVFEIAGPRTYRTYKSYEPSYYRFTSQQANDVYNFLVYIDKQFSGGIYVRSDDYFEAR